MPGLTAQWPWVSTLLNALPKMELLPTGETRRRNIAPLIWIWLGHLLFPLIRLDSWKHFNHFRRAPPLNTARWATCTHSPVEPMPDSPAACATWVFLRRKCPGCGGTALPAPRPPDEQKSSTPRIVLLGDGHRGSQRSPSRNTHTTCSPTAVHMLIDSPLRIKDPQR